MAMLKKAKRYGGYLLGGRRRVKAGFSLVWRSEHGLDKARERSQTYCKTKRPYYGLNVGCGAHRFDEWLNIDIGGEADVFWNLENGLPFLEDDSFDFVFAEHVIEHFPRKRSQALLAECHRVLKPGGIIRLAVPDLDLIIRWYNENSFPPEYMEYSRGFSENYDESYYSRGEYLDVAMRAWGHTYMFNEDDLKSLARAVGFKNVERQKIRLSKHPELTGREVRPESQSSLIVEASK